MKVSALTGPLLDYWVAKADGKKLMADGDGGWFDEDGFEYSPSTDWSQGGPIIYREGITIAFHEWYLDGPQKPPTGHYWRTYMGKPAWKNELRFEGLDPLIIAMQTFVASKFGEAVPDE